MKEQLYPHNQQAYEKVMKAFETSNRTCIIQPTGTGKSYVVAAVCGHFQKIMILAPNIFVLNQQKKVISGKKDITYMTYAGLLSNIWSTFDSYDLIVLDEFHRAGASEWGAAVNLFLEEQIQAKILGTSATPIRYLDGEKDMANELFQNNVASELTMAEAWHLDILPIPIYVTGFFSFNKLISETTEVIQNSRRISQEEKRHKVYRLSNMRLDWEKSNGVANILGRHISKDSRRIIVFCAHINNIMEMQAQIRQWFSDAGLKISDIYILHSELPDRMQMSQMADFSKDSNDGIKIMLAVNMLNEGIHIPDVNAIIMLRTTSSRIIFLQQLGRCLTASSSEQPLVLDLVDNITTTSAINEIISEYNRLEESNMIREGNTKPFTVYDYTLGIQQLIEKLTYDCRYQRPLEESFQIFKAFCIENGRLPKVGEPEWRVYQTLYAHYQNNEEFQALVQKYRRCKISPKMPLDDRVNAYMERIEKFLADNGRMPNKGEYGQGDVRFLRKIFHRKGNKYYHSPKLSKFFHDNKIGISRCLTPEERLELVEDFCKEVGRRPTSKDDPDIYRMYYNLKKDHPELPGIQKLLEKYPLRNELLSITGKLMNFYNENHRFPISTREKKLYGQWRNLKRYYPDNPKVKELAKLEDKQKTGKASKTKKPVYQFSLEGNFIKEWESASKAAAELGINRQNIRSSCLGKYKQCGGYIWSFSAKLQ